MRLINDNLGVDYCLKKDSEYLIKVKADGNKSPIFCMPPLSGDIDFVREVAPCFDSDQPLYGFLSVGFDGKEPMLQTIEEIAARYVKVILQEDPVGPYILGGYSLGGIVVLEVAHQLAAIDKKIDLAIIFDTYPQKEGKFTYFQMYVPFVLRSWFNYLINPKNSFRNKVRKIKANIEILTKHIIYTYNKKYRKVSGNTPNEEPSLLDRLKVTNFVAGLNYQLKPYSLSNVVFFRAMDNPARHLKNFDFGWKKYIKSNFRIVDLEGHHFYFMQDEKNREMVAKVLKEYL